MASSFTHTSRLRQTVERKQGQLSRIAGTHVLRPAESILLNRIRLVKLIDKGTI